MNKQRLTKQEICWSLYDVANSAYILLLTAVIPIYMKSVGAAAGYSNSETTSHWGVIQAAGTFVVALLAPVLGAMADYQGRKKRFFAFFFGLSIVSMFAMIFVDNYFVLLVINLITSLGYAGANNFYDAFLVDVTTDDRMDYVSSFGYAVGYIGSCIPFIVCILLILLQPFGLSGTMPVKISLGITAVWWLVFTIPMLRVVKQKYGLTDPPKKLVRSSICSVWKTFRKILKDKKIGLFLLAYFFYIDGVDTIIRMSTSFGADVGIAESQLVLALLVTQIVAFPAVLVCAKLVNRFSSRNIILFSIAVYVGICVFGFFLSTAWQFWVLAIAVAVVQGTIQALSRSYFGKLIPKEANNEYFGFYNILGKYATILGPLLMALFTTLTGNSRYGVLSIAVLFVAGFVTFCFVPDVEKGRK